MIPGVGGCLMDCMAMDNLMYERLGGKHVYEGERR